MSATARYIIIPANDVREAVEAFDRIWQNANVSEAARRDAEAGIKALQRGRLMFEAAPDREARA